MAFTYFFRDIETLSLVVKHVLPTLSGYSRIRIWDAGCAHGPEPYSIAIMLRENMSHFLFRNVRIHATDVSAGFGAIIEEGVFPAGEVKRIPSAIKARYFTEADKPDHYRIDDKIKASVSFARHDLLSLEPIRSGFSLIVCKNVLLHLSPAQRVDVIKMFHDSLRDGGFLVMEQTQKLPGGTQDLFEPVTCRAQVLRKLNARTTERIAA